MPTARCAGAPPADVVAAAFDPRRMFDHPDPYPLFAAMRRSEAPVAVPRPGRPLWAITRHRDVCAALDDAGGWVQPSIARVVFGQPRRARAARHARIRAAAARCFAPGAVARWAPRIAAVAHALLEPLAAARRAELVAEFARVLPLVVVSELVGIPEADRARVLAWSHELIGAAADPGRATAAAQELDRRLGPVVHARRAEPRDDVVSRLLAPAADGAGFSDAEVLGFLRVLVPAAVDPPAQMLGSLLVALLAEPARLERLRADRRLVPAAVAEALRWEAPIVYVVRQATRPVAVGGVALDAGTEAYLVLGSANRDESVWPDPDRFDLDRCADQHLAFGRGRHRCLGASLATAVGGIALDAVLDQLPRLRRDPDAAPPSILGFTFRQPDAVHVRLD